MKLSKTIWSLGIVLTAFLSVEQLFANALNADFYTLQINNITSTSDQAFLIDGVVAIVSNEKMEQLIFEKEAEGEKLYEGESEECLLLLLDKKPSCINNALSIGRVLLLNLDEVGFFLEDAMQSEKKNFKFKVKKTSEDLLTDFDYLYDSAKFNLKMWLKYFTDTIELARLDRLLGAMQEKTKKAISDNELLGKRISSSTEVKLKNIEKDMLESAQDHETELQKTKNNAIKERLQMLLGVVQEQVDFIVEAAKDDLAAKKAIAPSIIQDANNNPDIK